MTEKKFTGKLDKRYKAKKNNVTVDTRWPVGNIFYHNVFLILATKCFPVLVKGANTKGTVSCRPESYSGNHGCHHVANSKQSTLKMGPSGADGFTRGMYS